ncbi:MAG: DUF3572 domain-containing protein [Sphingomicrobium sp.]
MNPSPPNNGQSDSEAVALSALAATLTDERRAERFLSITGLSPDGIRRSLDDRHMLAACLGFLENHEPDLIAVAAAIGEKPDRLIAARAELEA